MTGRTLDPDAVRLHWQGWASSFGTDLRATTRSPIAKMLEIAALARRLSALAAPSPPTRVLEVGCGNGVNCIALAQRFPKIRFDGVDYIPDMVAAASESARAAALEDRATFRVGDVNDLDAVLGLESEYDVVFTDRCLINLASADAQKRAIAALAARVRPGGHLLMIENSTITYARQNACRVALALDARVPAAFNVFFDEDAIRPHLPLCGLALVDVEDFASLHDLLLYVLLPSINGGTIDYEHPIVQAAAKLSVDGPADFGSVGALGQNRLFVCRRDDAARR